MSIISSLVKLYVSFTKILPPSLHSCYSRSWASSSSYAQRESVWATCSKACL
jgi:hypothetical protein